VGTSAYQGDSPPLPSRVPPPFPSRALLPCSLPFGDRQSVLNYPSPTFHPRIARRPLRFSYQKSFQFLSVFKLFFSLLFVCFSASGLAVSACKCYQCFVFAGTQEDLKRVCEFYAWIRNFPWIFISFYRLSSCYGKLFETFSWTLLRAPPFT